MEAGPGPVLALAASKLLSSSNIFKYEGKTLICLYVWHKEPSLNGVSRVELEFIVYKIRVYKLEFLFRYIYKNDWTFLN